MYMWYGVCARVCSDSNQAPISKQQHITAKPAAELATRKRGTPLHQHPYERCILVTTLLSVFTWGRDQCLHALFNDRGKVHGQHSSSFSMTGIQYMVSTCPEKRTVSV